MEQLPQSKGKGAVMFARCRQRIDEIAAEHEELRRKGIPVEAFLEPESDISLKSLSQKDVSSVQQNTQVKHNETYHQTQHRLFQQPRAGINGLGSCPDSSASKPLVTNRTAEPFLIGLNRSPTQFSAVKGDSSPTMKKYKNIFKVPVPVNTTPQVWSPTGDIIASRDERIAVPAIKTVFLPEMKRRGTNKTSLKEAPEEDHFSLGAEACNFMQTPTIRQKHPPPILPKPTINPHCPPWSAEDDATHSPLTPSKIPVLQENWVPLQPQPDTRRWAPSSTQAIQLYHMSDHLPAKPSASSKIACLSQPQQPLTTTSPSQSKPSWTKPHVETSSVVSCPAQRSSSYVRPSKIPSVSSISEIGSSQGPILKGKGAELFARRQSRMEKFIVDAETVQANIARASSPTQSMPSTWKYSSNVRAPPPVSYDPTVSPFYPLAAQKQSLPLTTSNIKPKGNTEKPKTAPKHLSVMEIMKHQPYKLDSALFTYAANAEAKGSSPKVSPVPPRESIKTQVCSPTYLHNISQVPSTGSFQTYQQGAVTKPSGPVSLPYPFTLQSTPGETRPPAQAALMKMPAVCMMRHGPMSKAFSSQSTHAMRTGSNAVLCTSSFPLNSEIISRCNLPIAPKPKFSARKGSAGGKQWKPVVPVLH